MTRYTTGGRGGAYVLVGERLCYPAEARRIADEYESAVPILRAAADQAEANGRALAEREERERAAALQVPGAFLYNGHVYVCREDRRGRLQLYAVDAMAQERGDIAVRESVLPAQMELVSLPGGTLPTPIWVRNSGARTAHLTTGFRTLCDDRLDYVVHAARDTKRCPKCAAMEPR